MRAILINPEDRTVNYIKINGDYQSILGALDCERIDLVRLPEFNDMFVDDEGLFTDSRLWKFEGDRSLYAGRGLILGAETATDEYGDLYPTGEGCSTDLDPKLLAEMIEFTDMTAQDIDLPPIVITTY